MSVRAPLLGLLLAASCCSVHAAVVRIGDGDCPGLAAAAAAARGSEPSLIVLATKGRYGSCELDVTGSVTIDGAGAVLQAASRSGEISALRAQITVHAGASLTLRQINLSGAPAPSAATASAAATAGRGGTAPPALIIASAPVISNAGQLTLDAVSLSGIRYASTDRPLPMIVNGGALVLRNVTAADDAGGERMIANAGGTVDISQSTFAANSSGPWGLLSTDTAGTISVANSVLTGAAICTAATAESPQGSIVSRGGNVASDDTCGLHASGDRVVGDAQLGAFGDNGGLVDTVLLRHDSPAVHNGLAANCEATDARGIVRNVAARSGCDAGAYEFGGGRGLLAQGGMNGFFYDAAADGHYVTVQRLDWGSALVIWNTFDRNGAAAWIYAIGSVDGTHIHAQGAQNLGGMLQPGGAATGSHGFIWGDIDIDLADCLSGTFAYRSPLPNFGAGEFPLNRLAFLGDLDCSR